jgi:hypothetical protein
MTVVFGPSETLGVPDGENKATSELLLMIPAVFATWLATQLFELYKNHRTIKISFHPKYRS